MRDTNWKEHYSEKIVQVKELWANLRNGQTVFIGSGAGKPLLLTESLAEVASGFRDIEIIYLAAGKTESKLAQARLSNNFHYNTFYIGQGGSGIVDESTSDYTAMDIRELPAAMESGVIPVDVAMVQVSPPDHFGHCSLGVSVDATRAAVENAKLVIAQVNEHMPVTTGNSFIPMEMIDLLVEGNRPLLEEPPPELDPISLTIGNRIASLIADGTTLHFDRSPISSAAMRYLDTKKDLGIHTDVLTDDVLRLSQTSAVTNRKKSIAKGRTTATMIVGTKNLYESVDGNHHIELLTIDEEALRAQTREWSARIRA
jgi:4-hydroxybutyrate CoA-transferase